MMSIEYIESMARQAGITAQDLGTVPHIIRDQNEIDSYPPFPFPALGTYRPDGWELVDEIFADKSGLGTDDEPALSTRQLKARLKVGYGYAIIEEGQFQVYLGEFVPPAAGRSG